MPMPPADSRRPRRLTVARRASGRAEKALPKPLAPGAKGHERQLVGPIVQTLSDRVASRAISAGYLISEQDICAEFGVSRSSAREALAGLQHRGLVVRPPNRSAIVTKFTAEEIYETFRVREMLEGLCFRLATENEQADQWQDLVDLYAGPMEEIVRRGDFAAHLKNIDVLNHRVRTAARNRTLLDMLESIDVKSRYVMTRTLMLGTRLEQGLSDLRAIIAAMRRGDALRAEKLRRGNIVGQREFFRRYESLILD
jgi:DNA-binding GntR family transcriptional regulator